MFMNDTVAIFFEFASINMSSRVPLGRFYRRMTIHEMVSLVLARFNRSLCCRLVRFLPAEPALQRWIDLRA